MVNGKLIKKILIVFTVFSFVSNCDYHKMPLPSERTEVTAFGANDTSYIEIKPVWDSQFLGVTLNRPKDIIIGPDGYLWIANSGNHEIIALEKDGSVITNNRFTQLSDIKNPLEMSLDSKLNLFIVNASDTIYVWNEYFNMIGIDAVAFKGVFRRSNADTVHYPIQQTEIFREQGEDSLHFESYLYSTEETIIRKISDVHPFYIDPQHQKTYYGVASQKNDSGALLVSESSENRVAHITYIPQAKVRLQNGEELIAYKGHFDLNVVTFGSGAGTVDTPRGLYMDEDDNLYLTQWGGNFLVQKLITEQFISQYELHRDPIMDLNRFEKPTDITLDDKDNIFVVDQALKKVFKFDNTEPGAGDQISLGSKGLAVAEFIEPWGIMFADNVVYVTDAGANQIRRFKLSISESDIPQEPGRNEP